MSTNDIKRILDDYKKFPSVAIWKALIIKEGINTCIDKSILKEEFKNYKVKYAVKNPQSINHKVLDISSDERVIPSEVILKNNKGEESLVKLRFNPKSPLSLVIKENGDKSEIELKAEGMTNRIPLKISLLEEKGDSVVSLLGKDRLSVILFDGCWNWNTGKQCHFCDLNPKRKDYKSAVPTLNNLCDFKFNYKEWWAGNKATFFDSLKKSLEMIYPKAQPHKHLLIMSGGFINNEFLWETILEFVNEIKKIIPLKNTDNYINVPPPSTNINKNFRLLKNLGVKQIQINLEVVGKREFDKSCPGKAETIGYDIYRDALKIGVEIFGKGFSRSNFVFTANISGKLLEEARNLAKEGVVLDYSIFQPKKGTRWFNKETPSVEEILDFTKSLADIYRKNRFKGIYCNLSSRSSIINELLKYGY